MRDEYGVLHQVWKVSDPSLIDLVQGKMRDKKLIIADGHHRYETSLNYRNERRAGLLLFRRSHAKSSQNPMVQSAGSELAPHELR